MRGHDLIQSRDLTIGDLREALCQPRFRVGIGTLVWAPIPFECMIACGRETRSIRGHNGCGRRQLFRSPNDHQFAKSTGIFLARSADTTPLKTFRALIPSLRASSICASETAGSQMLSSTRRPFLISQTTCLPPPNAVRSPTKSELFFA